MLNRRKAWLAKITHIKFAVCVDATGYPVSAKLHQIYQVLSDEDIELDGDLRVVDESCEGYLYPAECFVLWSHSVQ